MSIESALKKNDVWISASIRMAFLFPILAFIFLGSQVDGSNNGIGGAAVGLVVGILAGGFLFGLLMLLREINYTLTLISERT
ncbi:MAG: hypothetical protein P8J45_03050 [Phycisphaerales bacterium]|nr:hypothetical protein [Phycisphaerales bacterium]